MNLIIVSQQALGWKRASILLILCLLCYIGSSGCFQPSTNSPFNVGRRIRQHQLLPTSQQQPQQQENHSTLLSRNKQESCQSSSSLGLFRKSNYIPWPRFHPLRARGRLYFAANDGDDESPTLSKVRSFLRKVWNTLSFPVRKPLGWIRKKLRGKEETTSEDDTIVTATIETETEPTVEESTIESTEEEPVQVLEPTAKEEAPAAEKEAPVSEKEAPVSEKEEPVVEKEEPVVEKEVPVVVEKETMVESELVKDLLCDTKPAKRKGNEPVGDRWAIAAPGVDLSGDWTIIVTDDFRHQYDEYLKQLGQPFLVRSVALTIIPLTTEETRQSGDGRTLLVRGKNARGLWERTLVASGADLVNDEYTPIEVPVMTADDERVQAESWWEGQGTVHRSWMRGLTKYGGGDFESKRYLDEGGKVLVCESVFHPTEADRDNAHITWRFLRNGESL